MAGKLVSLGSWFGREAGLAGKLVWQGKWFGRENGLAGKLVWQGNLFFVTLGKTLVNTLVVKQSTSNAKFYTIKFCDFFKKRSRWQ